LAGRLHATIDLPNTFAQMRLLRERVVIERILDRDLDRWDWALLAGVALCVLALAGLYVTKPHMQALEAEAHERAQVLRDHARLETAQRAQFASLVERAVDCARRRSRGAELALAHEADCARQVLLELALGDPEAALALWHMARSAGVQLPERFGDPVATEALQ